MTEAVKPGKTGLARPAGLRAARVLENEERIVRAAHELFVRDGYQATTLTAVADAAGVAHRTVYVRFGTKAALLKRVIDVALVGDLAPIDVVSREWYSTATTASALDARIAAMARGSARLLASAADVIAVAREAEATEPLLAAAAQAGRAATRDAIRTFWTRAHDDGLLPAGCDLAWLADTTSVLAHAETYLLMRETLEMTPERYQSWLATTWRRMVAAATR
jgi:AcrR family transcriptional regulator